MTSTINIHHTRLSICLYVQILYAIKYQKPTCEHVIWQLTEQPIACRQVTSRTATEPARRTVTWLGANSMHAYTFQPIAIETVVHVV